MMGVCGPSRLFVTIDTGRAPGAKVKFPTGTELDRPAVEMTKQNMNKKHMVDEY